MVIFHSFENLGRKIILNLYNYIVFYRQNTAVSIKYRDDFGPYFRRPKPKITDNFNSAPTRHLRNSVLSEKIAQRLIFSFKNIPCI